MTKTKKRWPWLMVGIAGALLAAPNATIIKYTLQDSSPALFNVLRFGILALLLTPYILMKKRRLKGRALRDSLLVGVFMATAVLSYVSAIHLSQASYVTIITLLTPIVFIFYAVKLDKEKLTHKSIAGISLAAAGAFTIVATPIMLKQGGVSQVYPEATMLALINCLSFPLAIIYSRRAHKAGAPLVATLGVSAWVVTFMSIMAIPFLHDGTELVISKPLLFGALYSSIAVALVARFMNIVVYTRLGSVANSVVAYIETLLAVILPVFILGEVLSVEMVVGGILILLGVYVVEYHRSTRRKQARDRRRR